MPFSNRFYEDQHMMLTTWSGELVDADLIHHYMGVYNNSHWQPGFDEIIDLRDANMDALSDQALEQLSELTAQCLNGESHRLALIAPSNLSHKLARLYKAFTHVPNESTRVFHHMSEAVEWLKESS